MTAPTRTCPACVGTDWCPGCDTLDAQLLAAFGPSDPATDAWVAASLDVFADAALLIGRADYGQRAGAR